MKHVHPLKDRHGKIRLRFRMAGRRERYLKSTPGTPEFEAEIETARNDLIPATQAAKAWSKDLSAARKQVGPVVYFVGATQGPVKIGHTSSLYSRLVKLQVGHPQPLRVLATIPGGEQEEARIHRLFSDARIRGEWFRRTPELRAFIRENG